MSESPPFDYIELNMSNYDDDDVSQLNQWGIWASERIDELERQLKEKQKAIQQAFDILNPQAE